MAFQRSGLFPSFLPCYSVLTHPSRWEASPVLPSRQRGSKNAPAWLLLQGFFSFSFSLSCFATFCKSPVGKSVVVTTVPRNGENFGRLKLSHHSSEWCPLRPNGCPLNRTKQCQSSGQEQLANLQTHKASQRRNSESGSDGSDQGCTLYRASWLVCIGFSESCS